MVVSNLWCEPGNIRGFVLGWKILPTRIGYCSNINCVRRFRCEDNTGDLLCAQPHYYRWSIFTDEVK